MKELKQAQELILKFLKSKTSTEINLLHISKLVDAGIKEIETLKNIKNDSSTNN